MSTVVRLSKAATTMRSSVFATLAERLKKLPAEGLPLHIGDTYRLPPEAARLERFDWASMDGLYKYSHPFGNADLLEALAEKLQRRNHIPATRECLQITCGATHALSCCALTLLDAGDEVLILAPFWPLIPGVVTAAGATPVQVPFTDLLLENPDLHVAEVLEPHLTQRTRVLYFANPNNPDGAVYSQKQLEALAEFCRRHDLCVLSDEAYEDYRFDGRKHLSMASLPDMFERTFTAFTFSKSYAMAGARLGYAVGPAEAMVRLRRVTNHTVYNVCSALQKSGLAALQSGDPFLEESRRLYSPARDAMAAALEGLCPVPEGGAYCFVELPSEELAWKFLYRALDLGLATAPGEAFGQDYRHCLRICFTAAPPEGIERAAGILRTVREEFGV